MLRRGGREVNEAFRTVFAPFEASVFLTGAFTIDGMITRGIRDFVSRDWAAARAAKDRYWADRIARLGAAEGLRIAEELRQQALLQDPAWPRPEEREADLLAHIRVAELMRRARPTRSA